jgi:two-component system nitrate/nitrite sensor histidine kinase NarX
MSKADDNMNTGAQALRKRLWLLLAGLLLVVTAAVLGFALDIPVLKDPANRTLLSFVLIVTALLLGLSLFTLMQKQLRGAEDTVAGATGNPDTQQKGHNLEGESLRILYDVVASINTAHSLDDLLSRFLYTFRRITQARGAAIWIEHNQQEPELSASSGINEGLLLPDRHDVRRCLYERAATEGKIWVEKTLQKCEKIAGQRFFEQDNIGLVSVPIRYRGQVTGVINLFLDTDMINRLESIKPLLTSIAHHLGIAIERYHDDEENRAHLIKEERTRIAHELHDSLAQTMASLRFQVRVLDETLHQGDESTTWQQLERIENSLDEANTELRALIANFRAPLYKRGLVEAIEQMVSQFRNETRIRTYLQKDCTDSTFPKDTETQILRIIQESLWNIRKHSQAKTVRILLRNNRGDRCHILIEDDGVGINKKVYGSAGEHVGLTIMRERASKIGGELKIESEPGEGTRVVLEISNKKLEQQPS